MSFARGKEGKQNRTFKLNKVGAKIATYHKLALIVHSETFEIVKYGEYEEMQEYIDAHYYKHPNVHKRTFRHMIYQSEAWLPEALEKMLDKKDVEFTKELEYPDTEHLFVDTDEVKGIGMLYHSYTVGGDPPPEFWKEHERRWEKSANKILSADDDAAEKRRQRSLKAAETMRKKREALALKNGDGKETR